MTVRLEEVPKIYNQAPVVNELFFKIKQGEIFGLLESNGDRKSTIIKILLMTLTLLSQGKVEVSGYDAIALSKGVKH